MGNIVSEETVEQTFEDPQELRSKISGYQTKEEKEAEEAKMQSGYFTSGDKRVKIINIDANTINNEVKYFKEYLYVWLGHENYNKLRVASKGFFGWNSHSFQMLTLYMDLYRLGKLDRDEFGEWNFTNDINDSYVTGCVSDMYVHLNSLYGVDLNMNCPHKDVFPNMGK